MGKIVANANGQMDWVIAQYLEQTTEFSGLGILTTLVPWEKWVIMFVVMII